jgi:penicillin-binding protein 1A
MFMDFMKVALEGQPVVDFKPPKNAKFAMVRGVREAFRPGTEPKVEVAPTGGPIPYQELPPGLPPVPPPAAQPGKPAQKPDPLSGLY